MIHCSRDPLLDLFPGKGQFGILLLLMLTGMEIDLKLVRQFGRAAIAVSLCGVAVPFACGAALGAVLPALLLPSPDRRLLAALFLGTALSISSIKIVAAVVREMDFTRRNLGLVIVSSAIMEDTLGWIIISIIFGLAQAAELNLAGAAKSVIGTAAFLRHRVWQSWYSVGQRAAAARIVFDCCNQVTAAVSSERTQAPMPPSKEPQLHGWRISLIKGAPAATIGYVEAPDAESAINKAIEEFDDPHKQRRLIAQLHH
jgi:hypothetical protein